MTFMDINMVQEECLTCHTVFTMTKQLNEQLRQNGKSFFCPQGHKMHYRPGHSELDQTNARLRAEVEELKGKLRVRKHNEDRGWLEFHRMTEALMKRAPIGKVCLRPSGIRALLRAGLCTLEAVGECEAWQIGALHGIGPVTVAAIKDLLEAEGLKFKEPEEEKEDEHHSGTAPEG